MKRRPTQRRPTPPDRQAMARAVADLLRAAGLSIEGELARTPERVAEAWADEFLDGYGRDAATVLGELHPAPGAGLVCVTGIDFHSTCPHHLLPYRGQAHLAYLPKAGAAARVAGFSKLAELVEVLAHRLVLQETLAHEIAAAVQQGTGARGAGCILAAEQTCLTCRAEKKVRARTLTSAFTGALLRDRALGKVLYDAATLGSKGTKTPGSQR